jgi:hypothetical protein
MIFVTNDDKIKMLVTSVKAREEEVLHYQVNIDNYAIAIDGISMLYPEGLTEEEVQLDPMTLNSVEERTRVNALQFKASLEKLLIEHELQRDKAQVMLDVVMVQLAGVDIKDVYETVK